MGDFGSLDAGSNPAGARYIEKPMIEAVNFPKFKKTTLLVFWRYASLDSLELISGLQKVFKNERWRDVDRMFVHVPKFDFEADEHNLRHFLWRSHIRLPLFTDPNRVVWREFGSPLIPAVVVVGTDGSILYEHNGPGGWYFLLTALDDIGYRMPRRKSRLLKSMLEDFVEFRAHNNISITSAIEFQMGARGISTNADIRTEGYLHFEKGRDNWMEFEFRGRSLFIVGAPVEREARLYFKLDSGPVKTHMFGDDLTKSAAGTYVRVDMPRLYSAINGGWGLHSIRIESSDALRLYSVIFR